MIKLALFALFCLQAALAAPTTTTTTTPAPAPTTTTTTTPAPAPTTTTTTTPAPAPTTTTEGCRISDDCSNDHRCIDGYCISEDIIEYWENNVQDWDMGLRRKRDAVDITAQLIPAEGDGEIVPLVCEGDNCVAKDTVENVQSYEYTGEPDL